MFLHRGWNLKFKRYGIFYSQNFKTVFQFDDK